MAFSNIWDTTFPPDTQLANLLGQDIRNGVKVDVQQRMAAISGLDAAKPAFGGDAQPANWNGILFFATDSGKIYQWNNPAWTDVTLSFKFQANATKVFPAGFTANNVATTFATFTVPALSNSGQIRVTCPISVGAGGGGGILINAKFGATVLATLKGAVSANGIYRFSGGAANATNSQIWSPELYFGNPTTGGLITGATEFQISTANTTLSQALLLQIATVSGTAIVSFGNAVMEVF